MWEGLNLKNKCQQINLFILICFVYQSIDLILEFTAFKTTNEAEIDYYWDENKSVKIENFPTISLCIDSKKFYNYVNDYNNTQFLTQYNISEKTLTNRSEADKFRQKLFLM